MSRGSAAFIFDELNGQLRFRGDFERLYQEFPDPWDQSAASGDMVGYYRESRRALLDVLARHGAAGCGLEVGCGHGHLTRILASRFVDAAVVGMDVSRTAIDRARALHPGMGFVVADLVAETFVPPGRFGWVVLAQCWWYVLHQAERAVRNLLACVEPGGLIVISQAFLHDQRYGRHVADGINGAVGLVMRCADGRLEHVESLVTETGHERFTDGCVAFRETPRC